ncbi:glycosyltransferase family 4 protein [Nitrobacter sp. TKz-YC02]|uniref:glycosyltransferase family 4 protein n=1 Tax=Nitrobacter sp. TKz-YC02 TaxID=3398704 RepID=UPI003CE7D2DD
MSGNVLFLSHEASRTGAPILLLNFLRWLHRNRNINMRVLAGKSGDLTAEFAAIGPVDSFEPSDALWYKAMRRLQLQHRYDSNHLMGLRRTFLSNNIDLIYVNSVASARMLDFLSFVKCPVICHVHELDDAIHTMGIEHLALLEKRRPAYIAVSKAVQKNLVEKYGISPDRIEVIRGCVPGAKERAIEPEQARKVIYERIGICEQAKLVCACGSIEFRKGTDLFLKVASQVMQKSHDMPVHFVWVGGTRDKVAAMQSQVANSSLRDVVHFVGPTSNTGIYFGAADVFVLTSREDPFPLVVMEAASHGKPTVCFEQAGGAPEFVEADAGFVVPDLDVAAMADRIVELLLSRDLCSRMGAAAHQKVISHYDFDVGAAKLAAIIEGKTQGCGDEMRRVILPR